MEERLQEQGYGVVGEDNLDNFHDEWLKAFRLHSLANVANLDR